jgi:hypothetical protein
MEREKPVLEPYPAMRPEPKRAGYRTLKTAFPLTIFAT